MTTDPTSLENRCSRLEREIHRLRTMTALAILGLVATAGLAVTSHPNSPSNVFTIRDDNGKVRVRIDGSGIHVLDAAGIPRILLGFSKTSGFKTPVHEFSDERSRGTMYLIGSGAPFLRMFAPPSGERVYLGLSTQGNAMLDLDDSRGMTAVEALGGTHPSFSLYQGGKNTPRWAAGINDVDSPYLIMHDSSEQLTAELFGSDQPELSFYTGSKVQRTYFGVNQSGIATMSLATGNGSHGYYLGVSETGGAYMKLYDGNHVERAYLGMYTDGLPGLSLYKPDGSVSWSTP